MVGFPLPAEYVEPSPLGMLSLDTWVRAGATGHLHREQGACSVPSQVQVACSSGALRCESEHVSLSRSL